MTNGMLFPPSERVIYKKTPLVEVVCQLRFSRILKIDSELPAAFQERIRPQFPQFAQRPLVELAGIPAPLARLAGLESVLGAGQQQYDFASADGSWTTTLTSQFLALTSRNYERWERFKELLAEPLQALLDLYRPAGFTRVGLRYQDVINRTTLGLASAPWHELLQDHVLGELCKPEMERAALHAARELLLAVGDDVKVRLQHGFATTTQDRETSYLIDADFFREGLTELTHATAVLDRLNQESGRLFRSCIRDKLHLAMDPQPAG